MAKNPCDDARTGWWIRSRDRRSSFKDATRSGKWLLYIHCPYVAPVWSRIVTDIRSGLLGPQAKVSTHKPSPLRRAPNQHVICVYTYSSDDKDDVLRVAKRLVVAADLKKMRLSYKRDADTLSEKYSWNSARGVAIHTFSPPYEKLDVPKGSADDLADREADGFCGGCQRPANSSRRKCPSCGWLFLSDPFACLDRDDLTPRQRKAIELELQAVALTGPRGPSEDAAEYPERVHRTLAQLASKER